MYNLLENRNKSFADFKKFMDYMVKGFYPCFNGIRVLT